MSADGAASAFNKANPERAVRPGDRVVRVDGETGSGKQMLRQLARSKGRVVLEIERLVA